MHTIEYRLGNALVAMADNGFTVRKNLRPSEPPVGYDLDLLYVECRFCGKPVLWEQGKTSTLVNASGIDVGLLDEECLILSEGCPYCRPDIPSFHLQVVRVAALSAQDLLLLSVQRGNA